MGDSERCSLSLQLNSSDVYGYPSRFFLTACRKEKVDLLPLAARKPNLVFPYRSPALTVLRAQIDLAAWP